MDSSSSFSSHANKTGGTDSSWRLRGPIHAERHVRIICVGAGASGLLFAYKLQKHFQNFSLTVYEKNPELSGTWFENKYPGCACDVPSHNYTWSFEPNPEWDAVYANSKQIFEYMNNFAQKYELGKYVKTNHQITGAYWNTEKAGYDITIKDIERDLEIRDFCHIFINASGVLNNWRWPDIQGLDNFKGKLLHTANYDQSVQLEGKRVGLIGNGSSGIQVLPAIQPIVKKLTTFVRSPTWVSPIQGLDQHVYTPEERKQFLNDPSSLTSHRKNVERGLNSQFAIFLPETSTHKETQAYMIQQMKDKISEPSLEEKLIPKWGVGCRRFTPGVGYLEALTKANVELVYGEIDRVTEKGVIGGDGKEKELDVLICATGFDVSFKPRFPIIGMDGRNLQDEWAAEPKSYFGLAAAGFPNHLIFIGPNSPIGNGPVLSAMEAQADYMLKLIDHYQIHTHETFSPSADAIDAFIDHKNKFMAKTVWTTACRSWYKNGTISGPVTALWPGSTLHYIEAISSIRYEDWNLTYRNRSDRFAWLGNGYSQTELDDEADPSWYIREVDDQEPLSTGAKRRKVTRTGWVYDEVASGGSSVIPAAGSAGKKEGGEGIRPKI